MSASLQRRHGWPWHVFGRGPYGYASLAADPELDPTHARRLERFAWGQTGDPAYGASLAVEPAMWIEPWAEHVAVSRVLRGEPDAAGRDTLCFHSVVVPLGDYLAEFRRDLAARCRDPRTWRRSLAALDATLDLPEPMAGRASAERVAWLRRAVEDHAGTGTSLVVPPGSVSLDDLAVLLAELPESSVRRLSLAHRAPTDALPCGLVVLDAAHRPEPAEHPRAALDPASGRATPLAVRIASPSIARLPRALPRRRPAAPAASPRTPELIMNRPVATAFAVLAVLVLILGFANLQVQWGNAARAVETELSRDAALAGLDDRLTGFEQRLGDLDARLSSLDALRDRIEALETAASAEDRASAALTGRFTALEQRLDALDTSLREVAKAIAALEARRIVVEPAAAGDGADEVGAPAATDRPLDAQSHASGQESSR